MILRDIGLWNGDNTGLRNFSYDTCGNVTAIKDMALTYDITDQSVKVSGMKDGINLNETYVYDGNMSFTYDMTDQPVAVGGTKDGNSLTETYVYDGNLKRVKAVTGGETIYRVYASGALIHTDNRTTGVAMDYIAAPLG